MSAARAEVARLLREAATLTEGGCYFVAAHLVGDALRTLVSLRNERAARRDADAAE